MVGNNIESVIGEESLPDIDEDGDRVAIEMKSVDIIVASPDINEEDVASN